MRESLSTAPEPRLTVGEPPRQAAPRPGSEADRAFSFGTFGCGVEYPSLADNGTAGESRPLAAREIPELALVLAAGWRGDASQLDLERCGLTPRPCRSVASGALTSPCNGLTATAGNQPVARSPSSLMGVHL